MKKTLATILALALVFSAVPAFAANETEGESVITLTFADPTPSYTISIPATIALEEAGSDVNIVASDMTNMEGKKVSVTLAGTQHGYNSFILHGEVPEGESNSVRYVVITSAGETLETTGAVNQHLGKELVSFTEDGADTFGIKPFIQSYTYKNTSYTGSLIYGIEVVEA